MASGDFYFPELIFLPGCSAWVHYLLLFVSVSYLFSEHAKSEIRTAASSAIYLNLIDTLAHSATSVGVAHILLQNFFIFFIAEIVLLICTCPGITVSQPHLSRQNFFLKTFRQSFIAVQYFSFVIFLTIFPFLLVSSPFNPLDWGLTS